MSYGIQVLIFWGMEYKTYTAGGYAMAHPFKMASFMTILLGNKHLVM